MEKLDVAFISNKPARDPFLTVERWSTDGHVLILSYGELASLLFGDNFSAVRRELLDKYLKDPGPHVVVCDEGHLLKNDETQNFQVIVDRTRSFLNFLWISFKLYASQTLIFTGFQAVDSISTKRKVILSGTPVQNNLKELHTMMRIVDPTLLGTMTDFKKKFVFFSSLFLYGV